MQKDECELCGKEEELLPSNCFLLDIGRRSYRVYVVCRSCAAGLRRISNQWHYVYTDDELAQVREASNGDTVL